MLLLLTGSIIIGLALGRIFAGFCLVIATLASFAIGVGWGIVEQIPIGSLIADIVGLTATLQGAYLLGLLSTRWTRIALWHAYTHHHGQSAR